MIEGGESNHLTNILTVMVLCIRFYQKWKTTCFLGEFNTKGRQLLDSCHETKNVL
jgi:hypothetical protein